MSSVDSASAGEGAVRVAVVGARGRMGRLACATIEADERFALAAALTRQDDLERGLAAGRADVGLDLTVGGLGHDHGRRMLACGVRPVIGTSGVAAEEVEDLDRLARARGLGGRVVANFSPGAWLLERLALQAARLFPSCELVETHHAGKRDAPSGTARMLARAIAARSGTEVPIHSLRLAGHYARHALHFGREGESLLLSHDTRDPAAFAPGILFALELVVHETGVATGLPWERRLEG